MMLTRLQRAMARPAPWKPLRAMRPQVTPARAGVVRLQSGSSAPLGLKDGSQLSSLSTNNKLILAYISFGVAAMITIARAKERDEDIEESARLFNMAKRAVVKDRRVFEAVGYPKEFEKIASENADGEEECSVLEGTFRVIGDKATAMVTYRHRSQETADAAAADGEGDTTGVPMFELLQVRLEDGSEFSALESYVKNEDVARQQKASSLGKKLFVPVVGGVLIGGVCSFLVIRIIRNRPFYVHKLVLDHVNNSDTARVFLGHPIKSNRKDYIGTLTDEAANYTVGCKGPKGEGTLIVKAYKKTPVEGSGSSDVMATPGTDWKFSTLVLSIKRNELRKEKEKTAKVIDLLADHQSGPTARK